VEKDVYYILLSGDRQIYVSYMNIYIDPTSGNCGIAKRASQSPGCGLDCKEELFGNLADRSQLCILQTLCEGAKTVPQIAAATGLSQFDVSVHLERLLDCGCVASKHAEHSIFYALSTPRLLELEGIVDEMLVASLQGHRAS
jgi:DNA-binding transcriptional ArsR family regulator